MIVDLAVRFTWPNKLLLCFRPQLLQGAAVLSQSHPPAKPSVRCTLLQSVFTKDRCIPALLNMATRHCSQLYRYPWIINHSCTAQQLHTQAQREQRRGHTPIMDSPRFSFQFDQYGDRDVSMFSSLFSSFVDATVVGLIIVRVHKQRCSLKEQQIPWKGRNENTKPNNTLSIFLAPLVPTEDVNP